MSTNECPQPASKSCWDSQDFGDISMVLKMAHFRKSTGPGWVNIHMHLCSSLKLPVINKVRKSTDQIYACCSFLY